jgi:hypothetical protein
MGVLLGIEKENIHLPADVMGQLDHGLDGEVDPVVLAEDFGEILARFAPASGQQALGNPRVIHRFPDLFDK